MAIGGLSSPAETHVHRYALIGHQHGCHWFSSTFECQACRAKVTAHGERDVRADPTAAHLFAADCHRC